MSSLSIVTHEQFGDVQVIEFDGVAYFNPDAVVKALEYKDVDSMLGVFETIPEEDMHLYIRHFTYQELKSLRLKGGATQVRIKWNSQGKRFLTEPGIFMLLNKSEKQNAYPFQKWVNTVVLPEIRKKSKITQAYFEALAASEEAKQDALNRVETLELQLDKNRQWLSLKRVSAFNGLNWKELSWRELKQASIENNIPPIKIFDANYGEVTAYHQDVWELVYPYLELPE